MIDRERIEDFVALHRIQVVVVLSVALALIVLVLIVSAVTGPRAKGEGRGRDAAFSIKSGDFWLPDEPLPLPGVQLFRERAEKWSPDEIKRWYTVPDSKALGELRSAGKKTVEQTLESVP
jgi:hypothetical protein